MIDLVLDRFEAVRAGIETDEGLAQRHAGETAAQIVAPAVIGTGQSESAMARGPIEQPRRAMAADIVERAYRAIVAAQRDDRLAQKIKGDVVAGVLDILDVAHDLPGRAEYMLGFVGEEFGVVIDPSRQALELLGIVLCLALGEVWRQRFAHRCSDSVGPARRRRNLSKFL